MISRDLRADDRPEQLTSPHAKSLYIGNGWLVAGCQHPGLELLRAQTTVAGHHSRGHRLDRDMQVLTPTTWFTTHQAVW